MTTRSRSRVAVFLFWGLAAGCTPDAAAPPEVEFDCQGVRVTVIFEGEGLTLTADGSVYSLNRDVSASGVRYEGSNASFWEHQGRATVTLEGSRLPECTLVSPADSPTG